MTVWEDMIAEIMVEPITKINDEPAQDNANQLE